MLFEYYELINEIGIHSQLDHNFVKKKKMGLYNFKLVHLNKNKECVSYEE